MRQELLKHDVAIMAMINSHMTQLALTPQFYRPPPLASSAWPLEKHHTFYLHSIYEASEVVVTLFVFLYL